MMDNWASTNYHQLEFQKQLYNYSFNLIQNQKLIGDQKMIMEAFRKYRSQILGLLKEFVLIDQILISPTQNDYLNFTAEYQECKGDEINSDNGSIQVQIKSVNIQANSCQYQQLISRILRMFIRNQSKMCSFSKNKSKVFFEQIMNQGDCFKVQNGMQILQHRFQEENLFILNPCFKVIRNQRAIDCLNDLVGQKVMNIPSKRIFKVDQIDYQMNPLSTFKDENYKDIQIIEYYKSKYNIQIALKDQPLIITSLKKKGQEKVIYLVPELCTMTGINPKLDHYQLEMITKQFSPSIKERVSLILTFIQYVLHNPKYIFFNWGIHLSIQPIMVPYIKLKAGMIHVNLKRINVDQQINQFSSGFEAKIYHKLNKKLNALLIVVGQNHVEEVKQTFRNINECTNEKWFEFPPYLQVVEKEDQKELQQAINIGSHGRQIGFIFFFLPGSKQICKLYQASKQISLNLAISSQIILFSTMSQRRQVLFYKMLIQVSAKIGDIPWMIEIIPKTFEENTLVCGIKYQRMNQDKDIGYFSITSTINYQFTRFYSQIKYIDWLSKQKVLQETFQNSLRHHNMQSDHQKLKNIIIYHEGVSVGEEERHYQDFKNDIFNILDQQQFKNVRVTIIFCNKSCLQKFYISDNNLEDKQYYNLEQGSIINDSRICQSNQFYLQSKQLSIYESSNPTCYKVFDFISPKDQVNSHLYDQTENQSFYQQIQHLTYQLCWIYFSFTGPVKIPAPLKYAHRLCNFYTKNNLHISQLNHQLEEKYYLYYL